MVRGLCLRLVEFPVALFKASRRAPARIEPVREYFEAMKPLGASAHSANTPNAYMQKTETLAFALIIEGEITLVLVSK